MTLEEFFNIENFEKLMEMYKATHIILAIDEYQRLFPDGYKGGVI